MPVGIENFEEIRTENFYYVDKTSMIRDLLNGWSKVNLFTRPRRFGKSLNMSMLQHFFEIGCDKTLFDGLEISKETAICEKYMGKFPVISISLKGVNGADYPSARAMFCSEIGNEALRFYELLKNSTKLNAVEQRKYDQLVRVGEGGEESFVMSDSVLTEGLKTLSALLEKHYGRKVIVLIDEYDVPLAKANDRGYYDEMVILLRNILEQVLKTNNSLYFAVLTGCLRVAKDSIFTGLNNLKVLPLTAVRYDEYFGFTEAEVKRMLEHYGFEEKYEVIREWYDGYRFGSQDIYCPWDVLNYCDELIADDAAEPRDYWSNTSGNEIIEHFIEQMDNGVARDELEALIAGETVTKEIHEELTYQRLYDSVENVWSVLFMTGYLTYRGKPEGKRYRLTIPNMEIRNIFTEQVMAMFRKKVQEDTKSLDKFCDFLKNGDSVQAEQAFTAYLNRTISIRDTFSRKSIKENFYHGILVGVLSQKKGWYVKSNEESGSGFADIFIRIENEKEDIGIIIEVKYAENGRYESACRKALQQIESKGYADRFRADGCRKILKYAAACYKKQCRMMLAAEEK